MAQEYQEELNSEALEALAASISKDRLSTYLIRSGHDLPRALRLYMWNAKLGEAFYVPIQAVEVGLRNSISNALAQQFDKNWWEQQAFLAVIDDDRVNDLQLVFRARSMECSRQYNQSNAKRIGTLTAAKKSNQAQQQERVTEP